MIRKLHRSEGGYVLVTALIAMAVLSILAAAAISQAHTALRMSRQAVRDEQALYMANAGVEMVYALVLEPQLIPENAEYNYPMQIAPGVNGSYHVVITDRPGMIGIRSTGTVTEASGTSTRVIEAEIPFDRSGGTPPPEVLVMGNGPLSFHNMVDVCGDMFVNGDLETKHMTVWARTTAQDEDSPCETLLGEGRTIVTGKLTKDQHSEFQAGWCDKDHYEDHTPCDGTKPQVRSFTPPDFPTLKSQATRWFVPNSESSYCNGKPAGTCQTFSSPLPLSGNRTYQDDLVYVEGSLDISGSGLTVTGNVTFAVNGAVRIDGDIRCAGSTTCNVAIVSAGDITVPNTHTFVRSTLFTNGRLIIEKTKVTIRGLISAGTVEAKNHLIIHPEYVWPVGVPGNPRNAAPSTGNGLYSTWTQ